MDSKDLTKFCRIRNRRFLERALKLPANLCRVAQFIVSHCFTTYTGCSCGYAVQSHIARQLGLTTRTVKRHVRTLRELGIFRVTLWDAEELREWFRERGFTKLRLTVVSGRPVNLYEANDDSPFWQDTPDAEALLVVCRKAVEEGRRKDSPEGLVGDNGDTRVGDNGVPQTPSEINPFEEPRPESEGRGSLSQKPKQANPPASPLAEAMLALQTDLNWETSRFPLPKLEGQLRAVVQQAMPVDRLADLSSADWQSIIYHALETANLLTLEHASWGLILAPFQPFTDRLAAGIRSLNLGASR